MTNTESQTTAIEAARMPDWVKDKPNQEEWNGRFIRILKSIYVDLDFTISAILDNDDLAQTCGMKIRSYVNKDFTIYLYQRRKAREAKRKKQLETAIAGMNAAIDLYTEQHNQAVATYLGALAIELSGARGRCKQAYATK